MRRGYVHKKLGDIFEGRGHAVDSQKAGDLYLQACRANADGCLALGDLVSKGTVTATQGSDADGMFARAIELAGQPCQAGSALACLTVADDEGHGRTAIGHRRLGSSGEAVHRR